MNKYDEKYEIRLAHRVDIEMIMEFIDKYWRKNHIMSIDKNLFEYEYVDDDNVNFTLAIDRKTNLLEGIFGFIKCSSTEDSKKKDIWGSMWMVNDSHDNTPFLGIELAKRTVTLTNCRMHIGNGANPKTTIPLRRMFFKDKVVKMKQYYLLNTDISEYNIAIINKIDKTEQKNENNTAKLVKFNSIDEIKNSFNIENLDVVPYKDNWYINRRYFCHPYYKYDVYGVENEYGNVEAIMVTREVSCNGGKVLRIVDYIGNQKIFTGLSKKLKEIINENNYEYIDFYTYGFDEKAILNAGFTLRTDDDKNVIPNYFEPFLRENVDIWAHYKIDGTTFFKADGDQDRPNILLKK